MKKVFIGIDNGVTGSIGAINPEGSFLIPTPVKKVLKYTKKKAFISRVDFPALRELLDDLTVRHKPEDCLIAVERPMVNPTRFTASASALRAFEATLIALEDLSLPYFFIDSKQWQKELLPSGLKGTDLKKASLDVGNRLFPNLKEVKLKDRDAILIAEFVKQNF